MYISKNDAKVLIDDYVFNGNASHFKYNGKSITGFFFTRKELNDLIKDDTEKELFLMLVLSPDASNPPKKYLNLVIGSILNDVIDTAHLIISSALPYTDPITFADTFVKSLNGDEITIEELKAMQMLFTNGSSNDHLTSTTGVKIKGYQHDESDLDDLLLRTPVTSTNENDLFIFIPVIRSLRLVEPFDRAYLSIATAHFSSGTVTGKIIEYCLPCPNACPSY